MGMLISSQEVEWEVSNEGTVLLGTSWWENEYEIEDCLYDEYTGEEYDCIYYYEYECGADVVYEFTSEGAIYSDEDVISLGFWGDYCLEEVEFNILPLGSTVEVWYEKGNPVAVNGEKLSPAQLLEQLNKYGGDNGIGRIDIVENRFVGMKSRGIYETPGGTILHQAHRAIESITLDREVTFLRDSLIPAYARMIYNGFWFSPERVLVQQMMDEMQKNVTGDVRLKLYKGSCTVLGRKAEKSLYNQNIASFEDNHGYSQNDADGFIKLNALRLKLYAETFQP